MKALSEIQGEIISIQDHWKGCTEDSAERNAAKRRLFFLRTAEQSVVAGLTEAALRKNIEMANKKIAQYKELYAKIIAAAGSLKMQKTQLSELKKELDVPQIKSQIALCNYLLSN